MDLIPSQPVVHPTAPIHIAVVQPYGRDTMPVMANQTLMRAVLRQTRHPVTNQEVLIHPFPYSVIGDEYARARNELVRIVFRAEQDATAQAQVEENGRAAAEGRKPGVAVPFRFDYMLWVDDDVMVPESVVEQLLAANGQVVSGLYFMRKSPYLPVAYRLTNDPNHPDRFWNLTSYPENQVIEVDAAGMGCMLIHTDVFRKMSEPWFAWQAMDARPGEVDHRSMGEDMYFCIGRGEPVLTKRGSISIEQVTVGDEVMTHHGRWKRVRDTSVRPYKGKTTSLKFYGDNQPIVTTPNHRYVIRRPEGGWHWQEAGKIQKGDFVGLPRSFDEKPSSIRVADWINVIPAVEKLKHYKDHGWLFRKAEQKSTRHIAKECGVDQKLIVKELQLASSHGQQGSYNRWGEPSALSLAERPQVIGVTVQSKGVRSVLPEEIFVTPELARCLGLYLAEGHTTSRAVIWSFGWKERHLVDFVSEHIGRLSGVAPTITDHGSSFQVCFGHTTLAKLFSAIFGDGAANKRVPSFVFEWIQIDRQREFLAGYIEGDGCVTGRSVDFTTVSPHIAYGIKMLLGSLGIPSGIHKYATKGKTTIQGREVSIQPYIFRGMISQRWAVNVVRQWLLLPGIEGNSNNQSHILSDGHFIWHEVVANEEISYDDDVFNLSVEDDESYTVRGMAVHNCRKAALAGYKILLSTGTICQHIGEYFYDEALFKGHQIHYFRRPVEGRMAICFLVAPSPKPWDGRTLYSEPLGGSESAVAYLARSLARLHHVVYVICSTNDIVDVDGVCYRPYSTIGGVLQQPWDALVVTRWPDAMTWHMSPSIKTVMFWAHDIYGVGQHEELRKAWGLVAPPLPDGRLQTQVEPVDAFVALTPWHASICQIPGTGDAPILSIPNGLDLSLFEGEEEKIPGRLIWTSNPNRGLMSAVRTFRELRKKWPHMELHIYGRSAVYGWSDAADPMHEKPYLPDHDEPGVFVHDPLPKPALAREVMKSEFMFYPATWPETFSIAVTEAQAAGTPVIATPYGALPQTVQGGILTFDFLSAFEEAMKPETYELLQLRGKEFARTLDWDKVAMLWEGWIKENNEKRGKNG